MTESMNTFVSSVDYTPNYNLLKNTNFYYSEIIALKVKDINNNVISENRKKYQTVLKDIWSTMRKEFLLDNTTYNMREIDENNEDIINESDLSRVIITNLSVSIRGKDAKGAIKEIIKLVKLNNYSIEMYLKLRNSDIFYYKY